MRGIDRKPLPSEIDNKKDVIFTEMGIDVKLPNSPLRILQEIEPIYKSPYFIILLFQILVFIVICVMVFK
ncbi:hypothetical protein LCGC14_1881690 [marine sediment metagenome]|uniref:Uncharacterized protein n=1 Tax=marine sediment metagenome TaxID=412755 RepID=A0A0F9G273_9ZZZZ